jgi:hypothetical protein
MLSWQKNCEEYVKILFEISITLKQKSRFLMVVCVNKHGWVMFKMSVIFVRHIDLISRKIMVLLGIFLVLPKFKRLHITCCSLCMLFDHLIQRDPAQVTFFKLCGLIDPYNMLLTNPSQSLRGYWDCLEVIRLVTSVIQTA